MRKLIKNTLILVKDVTLIRHDNLFIIDREPYKNEIISQILQFDCCEKTLLRRIDIFKKDFKNLRLRYLLLKMRTYIELARIQESQMTKAQLYELFNQEMSALYNDIQKALKSIED